MTWQEALEIVVAQTKHEAYRALCADAHPDREVHRARMIARATGVRPAYPPLITQAGNAIGAAGRTISAAVHGQSITVDQAEQERRLAICHVCDQYEASADRCRVCGCRATWKTKLAREHCPLNPSRW